MKQDEVLARDTDILCWKERQMIYIDKEMNKPLWPLTWFRISEQLSGSMAQRLEKGASRNGIVNGSNDL
jgi:hypothetical protein